MVSTDSAPTGVQTLHGGSAPRGEAGMRLLVTSASWIHRRVETVSFPANGETRRRVSWDFTLPESGVIEASAGQVAVPLTLMRKALLARLDVRDQSGAALPMWGTDDNGRLACEVVEWGAASQQGHAVTAAQTRLIELIVRATSSSSASKSIDDLMQTLPPPKSEYERDRLGALQGLAESLADSFILVVEMPRDVVARRTLVKINYDGELGGRALPGLTGRYVTTVDGTDRSGAASWHLEVQAPDGLTIDGLQFEAWDPETLVLLDRGDSALSGPTAHIAGHALPLYATSEARLVLRPDPTGLVNQTVAAALFSWVLLTILCLNARGLAPLLEQADRAGALAGVTLAIPAVLVAWMARGAEHELASRLLVVPRLLNGITALVLLVAATAMVLGLGEARLEGTMLALFCVQFGLFAWSVYVRLPVGANP